MFLFVIFNYRFFFTKIGYYKANDLRWQPAFRMYRGLFLVFLLLGLLGINVRGWNEGGVNHVLIFELDPRHHLQYVDILLVSV